MRAACRRVTKYADRALSSFDRCAVEEFPAVNGPADYALVLDGRVVAIVETKKFSLGPRNVLVQAERSAKRLGAQFGP